MELDPFQPCLAGQGDRLRRGFVPEDADGGEPARNVGQEFPGLAGVTSRGLRVRTNPTASAPASTAARTDSGVLRPHTLTNIRLLLPVFTLFCLDVSKDLASRRPTGPQVRFGAHIVQNMGAKSDLGAGGSDGTGTTVPAELGVGPAGGPGWVRWRSSAMPSSKPNPGATAAG